MKKNYFLLALLLAGLAATICCQRTDIKVQDESFCQYIPELVDNDSTWLGLVYLPKNSSIVQHDSSHFEVYFPDGYLLFLDKGRGIETTNKVSYTCTCSEGGGCVVFYILDGFGCKQSTCKGTCTSGITEMSDVTRYAMINTKKGISYVKKDDVVSNVYLPFNSILFEVPMVKEALHDFFVKNNLDEKSSDYALVNVMGCIALMPVSKEIQKSSDDLFVVKGDKFSCSCGNGDAGCVMETGIFGLKYCDNTVCTSCTMTIENISIVIR